MTVAVDFTSSLMSILSDLILSLGVGYFVWSMSEDKKSD